MTLRLCRGRTRTGAACANPAMHGEWFCFAHKPGNAGHYALQPKKHSKQCTAMAVRSGERCKNPCVWPYPVYGSAGDRAAIDARGAGWTKTTIKGSIGAIVRSLSKQIAQRRERTLYRNVSLHKKRNKSFPLSS
jgi:hypothetical protein